VTPIAITALGLELAPAVLFGCAAKRVARAVGRWPVTLRVSVPAWFVAPYLMGSICQHIFRWSFYIWSFYTATSGVASSRLRV
jgi:hypothetical protein